MSWLKAALPGLMWGLLWGGAKYLLLWKPLFRSPDRESEPRKKLLQKNAYSSSLEIRMQTALVLSLLLDAACLFALFFCRAWLPTPWQAGLIGAAVALSLSSRVPLLRKAHRVKENYERINKKAKAS